VVPVLFWERFGPCKDKCTHSDCEAARKAAAEQCIRCGQPIGYGRRYYMLREGGLAHVVCEEEFWKQAMKSQGVGA